MKRISLFILLSIAGVNNCCAIDVTTIDPMVTVAPVVVAASKLQAKLIVFFNADNLFCNMDYQTGDITTSSKSYEMNDLSNKLYHVEKEYQKKYGDLQDEYNQARNKWSNQQISQADIQATHTKYNSQRQQLDNERSSAMQKLGSQHTDVQKKITAIAIAIAKRMGACGVLNYSSAQYVGASPLIACMDPEYDITQEVFDTLNNEYNKDKPQKPACNNSCCVHCPLKNAQH